MRPAVLLARMRGGDVANVRFRDLVRLIEALGFQEVAGRGSHRVFAHRDVTELINLQSDGGEAKKYQVRQVARLVHEYRLSPEEA